MENKPNLESVSAAIAGFLACHVLTCRFLVQEGVVDRDRLTAYLEAALLEMSPGIEDTRALFPLHQIINALRSTQPEQRAQ